MSTLASPSLLNTLDPKLESKLESRDPACLVRHVYPQHLKHCLVRSHVLRYLFNEKNDNTVLQFLLQPTEAPALPSFTPGTPQEGHMLDTMAAQQCISSCLIGDSLEQRADTSRQPRHLWVPGG